MDGIRLGVAYYPEQDPESEWARDAALMRELGLDCIRVGEFCWSRMQRADGTLTLDWLERVVDLYAGHGIRTILCTPTATPPAWMCDRYPDLACVLPDGRQGLFGGRRHYSVFHEGYRQACCELAEALGERFAGHPDVIGWQIDNEAGSYSTVDCSAPALKAFHAWLASRYASPDELNRRWGLIFWNQEVERFTQVLAPTEMMTTRSPSAVLEYNRFCLEGTADFLLAQAAALRRHVHDVFVVASAVEPVMHEVFRLQAERGTDLVDAVTVHNYPELSPALGEAAMHLDRFRGLAPELPLVTLEQQLGSGNTTTGGLVPALRRYWAFEALASGTKALLWFHWRRFRTGPEWRHSCVVERDRRKRSVFDSLKVTIEEIRGIEPILADARMAGDVQVLYSQDNALGHDRASEDEFWMPIQLPDAFRCRFPMWEREVRRTIYDPLTRLGWTVDFVSDRHAWDPRRPLLLPAADICTDAFACKLEAFCRAGGRVICFPGAGERDAFGAHREAPPPGLLAALFGVELAEYVALGPRCGSVYDHQAGEERADAAAGEGEPMCGVRIGAAECRFNVRHGEVLDVRDAEVLGVFAQGVYRDRPVIARRRVGEGCAIYLGAVPATSDAAVCLWRALLPELDGPELAYRRVAFESGGRACAFLLNGAGLPCPLSAPVRDLITGLELGELPAYGVALVAVPASGRLRSVEQEGPTRTGGGGV